MDTKEATSPKKPEADISPITSTPGPHQISALEDQNMMNKPPTTAEKSELENSDESAILSSSLDEVSMTVNYERDADDITIVECNIGNTPVSYRTRSRSVSAAPTSMIAFNFETMLAQLNKRVEDDKDQKEKEENEYEMVSKEAENGFDSIIDNSYQYGYKLSPGATKNIWSSMCKLSQSFSNVSLIEEKMIEWRIYLDIIISPA